VRAAECFNGKEIFGKKLIAAFPVFFEKPDEDMKEYTSSSLSNEGTNEQFKLRFNIFNF
jgi:hypothetical protein